MRKSALVLLILLNTCVLYSQSSFISYYDLKDFMHASPGAFKYGLYGYNNPAANTYLNNSDIMLTVSEGDITSNIPKRWGVFWGKPKIDMLSMQLPSSCFGIISETEGNKSAYNFRYSFGFGNRIFNYGFGFGYTFGNVSHFNRSGILFLGTIFKPFRHLSMGVQRTFAFRGNAGESVVELAIRPIGTYPLAVYADAAMFDYQKIKNFNWSTGISWEFLDGIRINGRYFKDKTLSVGLDLSLGEIGFSSQSQFDDKQKYNYNSYSIRVGAYDRTVFDKFSFGDAYIKMDLKGNIKYQNFLWFDDSNRLIDLINKIETAKQESSIKGIVLNISGMNANMEIAWEIRKKLLEFREYGKKVIIFMDRASMSMYHFISVADKIIMDPLGAITLSGYATGRSYYKKLLNNAGIGFEELRYFKYKSAYENFGRDDMSEADREQRQKLINDWYKLTKDEICESRQFSKEEFDNLVNNKLMYTAEEALANKLIDTIGRWNDVKGIMKENYQKSKLYPSSMLVDENKPSDDKWGEPAKAISVIYALGACDMDRGIKARELSKYLKRVVESDYIGAIVLRVDSPGGDGMASDLVAEIMRKYKGKKPIIVSQGAVAASGGYWLSMDADTIVASPMTITGSIGVIGAWFYNKGLADSLGISTEIVKKGKYADLGYPFTLPLIPLGLPVRNLNDEEKSQMENYIKIHYKDFVGKVANGRNMEYEKVDEIAQGRVWSGITAKEKGLVDELGGLDKAIIIAKEMAGYSIDDEVRIIEYPDRQLLDFSQILSGLFGVDIKETKKEINILKFMLDNNGIPMPLMPIDYYQYVQDE
jgi:protease IV